MKARQGRSSKGIIIFLFFITLSSLSLAQERQDNAWKALFTDFSLTASKTLRIETHVRTKRFMAENDQYLFRPGLTFRLNRFSSLSFGVTFLSTNQPEHRLYEQNLWQQFAFRVPVKKATFFGWIRVEQRWQKRTDDPFGYSARIRFRNGFEYPLQRATTASLHFIVFNEVFLSTQKSFPYAYNQNWTFLGLKKKFGRQLTLLTGFQRTSVPRAEGFLHKNIWSSILFYRPGR